MTVTRSHLPRVCYTREGCGGREPPLPQHPHSLILLSDRPKTDLEWSHQSEEIIPSLSKAQLESR